MQQIAMQVGYQTQHNIANNRDRNGMISQGYSIQKANYNNDEIELTPARNEHVHWRVEGDTRVLDLRYALNQSSYYYSKENLHSNIIKAVKRNVDENKITKRASSVDKHSSKLHNSKTEKYDIAMNQHSNKISNE